MNSGGVNLTSDHLINKNESIKFALNQLNKLGEDLTLFVLDNECHLVGTLTDGDIRRALLQDIEMTSPVERIMFRNFAYLEWCKFSIKDVSTIRNKRIGLIPIVDDNFHIKRIVNLDDLKSVLPIDAVIMAGGEGRRLKPLTDRIPKPLLIVGNKPIIEYNIDRLINFGVERINITLKYLGPQIVDYFGDGSKKSVNIHYVNEEMPLGTIGAIKLIKHFSHDHVLIMNSDLLTNIDFEDFFTEFIAKDADMAIATIPYKVDVPYAVLETKGSFITDFKEKPTYTYYSNAGIYLLKKEIIDLIPDNEFFNATDLMELLIKNGKKVLSYPMLGYWLDIGKHDDFERAQEDVKHIKF